MKYYSQHQQDFYLNGYVFNWKRGGFFLDIGAHNGEAFSNTYFLEREMNWLGICMEPNYKVFSDLIQKRNCICLPLALANKTGKSQFVQLSGYTEMLSGLKDNYHSNHLQRIQRELKERGGTMETVEVNTISFSDLVNTYKLKQIDYCSLDVEGAELEILQSIDFDLCPITCFSVENNYQDSKIDHLLISKGYKLIKQLECDSIYLKS